MKKEIEQTDKRAKQMASHKKALEEKESAISKLQSDLQKLSELRAKDKEEHEAALAAAREAVRSTEEYCTGRFAVFCEMLSSKTLLFSMNPTCFCLVSLIQSVHRCCLCSLFYRS